MTARQIKRRKYGPPARYRATQVSLALELWALLPEEVRNPKFFTLQGIRV
jgi:hypothetical protein